MGIKTIFEIKVFDDNGETREIKASQPYFINPPQKSLSRRNNSDYKRERSK